MINILNMPDKLLVTSEPWVDLHPLEWILETLFGYSKITTNVREINRRITECLYNQTIWKEEHYFNAARELVRGDPVEEEIAVNQSCLDFHLRNSESKTYAIVDPFTMNGFLKYYGPLKIGFVYVKAVDRDNKPVAKLFDHIDHIFESRSYLQGPKFRGMTIDEFAIRSMYFMSRSLWRASEHD